MPTHVGSTPCLKNAMKEQWKTFQGLRAHHRWTKSCYVTWKALQTSPLRHTGFQAGTHTALRFLLLPSRSPQGFPPCPKEVYAQRSEICHSWVVMLQKEAMTQSWNRTSHMKQGDHRYPTARKSKAGWYRREPCADLVEQQSSCLHFHSTFKSSRARLCQQSKSLLLVREGLTWNSCLPHLPEKTCINLLLEPPAIHGSLCLPSDFSRNPGIKHTPVPAALLSEVLLSLASKDALQILPATQLWQCESLIKAFKPWT